MIKKILSLILAALFVIAVVPFGICAAENYTTPTFYVENATAIHGENVEINVKIASNPGVSGALLTVSYDPELTLTGAKSGTAFDSLFFTPAGILESPCNFVWDSLNEVAGGDGTVLTLTFSVPDDAEIGTEYKIDVSFRNGDIYDKDLNTLEFSAEGGKITVIKEIISKFYYDENYDGTLAIKDYEGNEEDVVIPTEIDGKKVRTFGFGYKDSSDPNSKRTYVFSNNTTVKTLTIPEGVELDTIVPSFALWDTLPEIYVSSNNSRYSSEGGALIDKQNKSLLYLPGTASGKYTVPEGVTSIESFALSNADISSLVLPSTFNNFSFVEDKLISIIVSEKNPYCKSLNGSVLSKDGKTLYKVPGGTSGEYTVPSSVVKIDSNAFLNCHYLTSINIPEGVESIGQLAFALCFSLKEIVLPNSLNSIGFGAFQSCTSLSMISIPENVTSINNSSFINCTNLSSVAIHGNVTSIADDAFDNCEKLAAIHGVEGSYTETFAKAKEYGFTAIKSLVLTSDNEENISVDTQNYVVPEGTELKVEKKDKETVSEIFEDSGSEKAVAFDIHLEKEEEKIQPNGKVTVKIPLPEGYDPEKSKICYVDSDGNITYIKSSVTELYIIFETDHFSVYAIVELDHLPGDVNNDGKVDNKDVSCLLQYLSDWNVNPNEKAIDINADGEKNIKDALRLFKYVTDKSSVEIY